MLESAFAMPLTRDAPFAGSSHSIKPTVCRGDRLSGSRPQVRACFGFAVVDDVVSQKDHTDPRPAHTGRPRRKSNLWLPAERTKLAKPPDANGVSCMRQRSACARAGARSEGAAQPPPAPCSASWRRLALGWHAPRRPAGPASA